MPVFLLSDMDMKINDLGLYLFSMPSKTSIDAVMIAGDFKRCKVRDQAGYFEKYFTTAKIVYRESTWRKMTGRELYLFSSILAQYLHI